MKATSYARLAAALFAIISVLQLVRALAGWPITALAPPLTQRGSPVRFWLAADLCGVQVRAAINPIHAGMG